MSDESVHPVHAASRSQWGHATAGLCLGVAALLLTLAVAWPTEDGLPFAFLVAVGCVLVVESAVVLAIVTQTRRTAGSEPFTLATWVTLSRAVAVAVLAGFVLVPPSSLAPSSSGIVVWIPAALFVAAAALDAVDGLLARRTDSVTALGARLDVETDALVVLVGTLVAVVDGTLPLAFLAVGVARYPFVAGCWWRRRRGRPVFDLPERDSRRVLGALAMGAIWLALLPPVAPAVTRPLAFVVLVPFLCHFCWDWLTVSGRVGSPE